MDTIKNKFFAFRKGLARKVLCLKPMEKRAPESFTKKEKIYTWIANSMIFWSWLTDIPRAILLLLKNVIILSVFIILAVLGGAIWLGIAIISVPFALGFWKPIPEVMSVVFKGLMGIIAVVLLPLSIIGLLPCFQQDGCLYYALLTKFIVLGCLANLEEDTPPFFDRVWIGKIDEPSLFERVIAGLANVIATILLVIFSPIIIALYALRAASYLIGLVVGCLTLILLPFKNPHLYFIRREGGKLKDHYWLIDHLVNVPVLEIELDYLKVGSSWVETLNTLSGLITVEKFFVDQKELANMGEEYQSSPTNSMQL